MSHVWMVVRLAVFALRQTGDLSRVHPASCLRDKLQHPRDPEKVKQMGELIQLIHFKYISHITLKQKQLFNLCSFLSLFCWTILEVVHCRQVFSTYCFYWILGLIFTYKLNRLKIFCRGFPLEETVLWLEWGILLCTGEYEAVCHVISL